MKQRLLKKIFSSGLQAISVQVLGGVFFYFISIYISKNDFGIISWANAASFFITTILGFGLEQVVVRRISASKSSDWAAAAFFVHSTAGFILTFLLLFLLSRSISNLPVIYKALPWFFLAQGIIFIGVPLKQFLNAKEKFTPYGIIAVISNLAKIAAAWLMIANSRLNIDTVLFILIGTACFELACLIIYLLLKTTFSFKFRFLAYVKLIKESSSQYLSVIFDMSLSRIDWVLLGLMATNVVLADYSIAYRSYELARLPMLIIAPIILPRFSRLMASGNKPGAAHQTYINSFNTVELFFAVLIPLVLNILWIPVLGLVTHGKYGESNSLQFLILSLCIPLQFFINLLWSLSFAAKKYKKISFITIACAVTNIGLNLVLIPKFNGTGAAVAFLTTTLLQAVLYYFLVRKEIIVISMLPAFVFAGLAVIIYVTTSFINVYFVVRLLIAGVMYLLITVLFKLITKQHIHNFKSLLTK